MLAAGARWLRETALKFSDAELSYRPATGAYSVGETLLHIAHEEEIEVRYGITKDLADVPPVYDVAQYADVASIVDVLTEVHGRTVVYLRDLTDEVLLAEIEAPWGARAQQAEMMPHVLEHELHHRRRAFADARSAGQARSGRVRCCDWFDWIWQGPVC